MVKGSKWCKMNLKEREMIHGRANKEKSKFSYTSLFSFHELFCYMCVFCEVFDNSVFFSLEHFDKWDI